MSSPTCEGSRMCPNTLSVCVNGVQFTGAIEGTGAWAGYCSFAGNVKLKRAPP
jgi:hypothetical protein